MFYIIPNHQSSVPVSILREGTNVSQLGNVGYAVSSAEELGNSRISTSELVVVYNSLSEKSISKFQDRATAIRRTWSALQAHKQLLLEDCEQEGSEVQEPKKGRKPGTGKNAGKRIYAKCKVNPRRAGTFGWHSYNLLLNKPEGVAYEDYISAGGRAKDLAWDVARKWAEVK